VLRAFPEAFVHFDMDANKAFKRQKYKASTGQHGIKRTGQEKLFYADLLACITYVSEYNKTPDFVIVAGGAPGVHFARLVSMFPSSIEWHLYDPECFTHDLQDIANVHTHQQLYTQEDCSKWSKYSNTLFLSDIRNVNYTPNVEIITNLLHELSRIPRYTRSQWERKKAMELRTRIHKLRQELEEMTLDDMTNQAQMVRDTQAKMAFVKFRLPYVSHRTPQFYTYLKGTVLFQPMNRCNSTECRLMVVRENASVYADVHYDVLRHEEQCAFINNNMRPAWDKHAIQILQDSYEALRASQLTALRASQLTNE
jgi:hypothetical protein